MSDSNSEDGDTIHIPPHKHPGEGEMPSGEASCRDAIADSVQVVILSMNQDHSAGQSRRNQGADFLAETTRLSHLRASESVSYREAQGQRAVNESGSGRTRVEANTPASGQVVGPV